MIDKNRQHPRIEKIITIAYCVADGFSKEWDMSVVKNISAGGVMFIAPGDLRLKGKVIQLKIGLPELAPHVLELQAVVVDTKACVNPKTCEVRVKFINLTEKNKENLSVVENMINLQEIKNAKKVYRDK